MLSIHYGDRDDVIYDTSTFFDYSYSPFWLQDPLSQRIIKSIDNGTVLGANAIDTKVLGVIPPEKLSTGKKISSIDKRCLCSCNLNISLHAFTVSSKSF